MKSLPPKSHDLSSTFAYWRASNYLAAAQIYLRENVWLREPLEPQHLKPRLLGHWGTVPGINFIYVHLNRLIREHQQSTLLITGPGHGAPANLAQSFLEGTLGECYDEYHRDAAGLQRLVQHFSWPGGFPSHITPALPGAIHEGGELGYALAKAFGAAMDQPDLMVACIVGDGEAETGPTAAAWHCNKFLNPRHDGMVLPILHLNSYKIASRTIFGSMSDLELTKLMEGYGYRVTIVDVGHDDNQIEQDHRVMAESLEDAYLFNRQTRQEFASGMHLERPPMSMIILRSPKGWTVTKRLHGEPIEGSYRAHQVPIPSPHDHPDQLEALEGWLRSYRFGELCDESGAPSGDWLRAAPEGDYRIGANPIANGKLANQPLHRMDWRTLGVEVARDTRGAVLASDTQTGGELFRETIASNRGRFRLFCPDEMDSNRLGAVFDVTHRQFLWPTAPHDEHISDRGDVLEILSEHTCQGWLEGYLLTGRRGFFPCYEAFVSIVDSMMSQFAKFLKRAEEIAWRAPIPSMNYLLSSEGWRQDHNGYSHQMPGFINVLLNKKAQHVRVYLPPDTNCLLSTLDHCFKSMNKINLVIASKQKMPQWLTVEEAGVHCERGISVWDWASQKPDEEPDVVLACAGVYPTAEAVAAAWMLRAAIPEIRLRFINVTDLLILELKSYHPHGLDAETFEEFFTLDAPVVFNFHGYPSAVKQLLWDRPNHERFRIHGYIEEGTTTTPFTLLADNEIDRFTLIDDMLCIVAVRRDDLLTRCRELRVEFQRRRREALDYAIREGKDCDSLTQWDRRELEMVV